MAALIIAEVHMSGEIIERTEITDASGAVRRVRTNPSAAGAVIEDRAASVEEAARFARFVDPVDPDAELSAMILGIDTSAIAAAPVRTVIERLKAILAGETGRAAVRARRVR